MRLGQGWNLSRKKSYNLCSAADRRGERGNVFFTLFGAVAVVGVLGAGIMSTMRGPLSTMVDVNRIEQAKSEVRLNASLLLTGSTDTDGDSYTEGVDPNGTGIAPTGGGTLPTTIGAIRTDPWGNEYGYCAWDHGNPADTTTHDGTITGFTNILDGDSDVNKVAILVVSAGPNGAFDTDCNDEASGLDYVDPFQGGGDDIIEARTYNDAIAGSGGLWTVGTDATFGDDTAYIDRNVDLTGDVSGFSSQLRLGAASMLLPTEADLGNADCNGANDNLVRINTAETPNRIEICDDSFGGWVAAGAVWAAGTDPGEIQYAGGNVGIGIANPSSTLHVNGTGNITGNTIVGGTLGVGGLLDVAGNIQNTIGTDVTIGDNLTVTGNYTSAAGNINIGTGDVTANDGTFTGNMAVTGNYTSAAGNINIGTGNINANEATFTDDVNAVNGVFSGNVSGVNGTFTGYVDITGADGSGDGLNVTNDLDVDGDVDVGGGNFTVTATNGNTTVGGTLGVTGDATFSADVIVQSSDSLIPPNCTSTQKLEWGSTGGWSCEDETAGPGGSGVAITLSDLDDVDNSLATTADNCLVYFGGEWASRPCAAGSNLLWEEVSNVIRINDGSSADYSTDDFVFGSPTLDRSTEDNRFFFDKDLGAFRAGGTAGTTWDTASIGQYSAAMGEGTTASGLRSTAFGWLTRATNNSSFASGYLSQATGAGSSAMGWGPVSSGQYAFSSGFYTTASGATSIAMGREAIAGDGTGGSGAGDSSAVFGLQSASQTTDPRVTGDRSFVIFMDGNTVDANSAYDFTENDKFAIIGGEFQIDSESSSAASKGCIRYNDTSDELEFSDDCTTYTAFAGGSLGLWTELSTTRIHFGTTGTEQVGIGTANPQTTLDVNGGVRVGTTSGGATPTFMNLDDLGDVAATGPGDGDCITYNNGTSQWEAASCASSVVVNSIEDADGDTQIQVEESSDDDTIRFDTDGTERMNISPTGVINIASGDIDIAAGVSTEISFTGGVANIASDSTFYLLAGASDDLHFGANNVNSLVTLQSDGDLELDGTTGNESGCFRYNDSTDQMEYSDDCTTFTPFADILSNANIWTDNTTHITRGNVHILDAGETMTSASFDGGSGDGLVFHTDKMAIRAGSVAASRWNEANIGNESVAMGSNPAATGTASVALGWGPSASSDSAVAIGRDTEATGVQAVSVGSFSDATANYTAVFGHGLVASTARATAYGQDAVSSGSYSMAFGAGYDIDASAGAQATVSGDYSIGFFMGDNDGINVADASTMAIMGGDFIVGSYQLDDTTTGSQDNRMFFDVSKGAFRAGVAGSTQWDDGNVGSNSVAMGQSPIASGSSSVAMGEQTTANSSYAVAMGFNTTASGQASTAFGDSTTASGSRSTALGEGTTASGNRSTAMGYFTTAGGNNSTTMGLAADTTGEGSMAFGLTTTANWPGTNPVVSGDESFGIFMGDQDGYDLTTANRMALVGGDFLIDNDGGAGSQGCLRYSGTALEYSDDCTTYTAFSSGGLGLWTDNTTHITRETFHVLDAGQTSDGAGLSDAGGNGGGRFAFYDSDSGALRGGEFTASNDAWDDANIGDNSIAWGLNAEAAGINAAAFNGSSSSGLSSFASGFSVALGDGSFSHGFLSLASGTLAVSLGAGAHTSGEYGVALGHSILVGDGTAGSGFGDNSMGIGLGQSAGPATPRVTGDQSLAIVMGDHTGYDLTASNRMALVGGDFLIDNNGLAGSQGCLRYSGTQLEYSDDCTTFVPFSGGGLGLWTDNTTHITRENFHILDAGLAAGSTTASLDGDGIGAFFDPDKGAMRGGTVSGGNDAWEDANVGTDSFAWGLNSEAAGNQSTAMGNHAVATGPSSIALGNFVQSTASGSVALGNATRANGGAATTMGNQVESSGATSVAIGLQTATQATFPILAGDRSFMIFNDGGVVDANSALSAAADDTFAVVGPMDFIVGSYQLDDTTTGNEDSRMFFDVSKGAFRAGITTLGQWDDANVGANSIAMGANPTASGAGSIALGVASASAQYAIAIGNFTGASADASIAIGQGALSTGVYSTALGREITVSGTESMGIGLGDPTTTSPEVSGNNSLGIFMGDQSGYDLTTANRMALVGGDLLIDNDGSAGSQGCLRYSGTQLEYSHDCSTFTTLGGVTAGAVAINDLSDGYTDYATNFNLIMGRTSAAALTSGAQYNLFVGQGAGATTANSTAATDSNTAVGYNALTALTSGANNVAIGFQAGDLNTSGSNNILIGSDVDAPLATTSNFMNIGDTIYGDLTNNFVGIGTTTPDTFLHVDTDTTNGDAIEISGTSDVGIRFADANGGTRDFRIEWSDTPTVTGTPRMRFIDGNGTTVMRMNINDVGLFTDTPAADFDVNSTGSVLISRGTTLQRPGTPVNGMLRYNSTNNLFEGYQNGGWQDIITSAAITSLSDIDGDTLVQVEESSDEDMIRFDTDGTERMIIDNLGQVGIGATPANRSLTVRQLVNGEDALTIIRNTDTAWDGNYFTVRNAADDTDLVTIGPVSASQNPRMVLGNLSLTSNGGCCAYNSISTSDNSLSISVEGPNEETPLVSIFGNQLRYTPTTGHLMDLQLGLLGTSTSDTHFDPSSGTAEYSVLRTVGTVEQSGTATGTTRGIYIDPNLVGAYDYRALEIAGYTKPIIGTPPTTLQQVLFNESTLTAAGATTVTNAATQVITGAPNAGTNVTITNPYAFWVQGDTSRFDGDIVMGGTGAITVPSGTNAQRPGTPVGGMLRYNTDASSDVLEFYDAEGTSWVALATAGGGAGAIDDLSDAAYENTQFNMFIGHEGGSFGSNNQGNTGLGQSALDALDNTTGGDWNTGLGAFALTANVTGDHNTAVGNQAMLDNVNGNYNTAMGVSALHTNVARSNNTAIGYESMRYADDTTTGAGSNNTALGYQSLRGSTTASANTGTENVAVGNQALRSITSGNYNNALGSLALFNNTTGEHNNAFGWHALTGNTIGTNNVAMGRDALASNVAKSGSTAIGYQSMQYADDTTSASDAFNTAIGYQTLRGSTTAGNNTGTNNAALGAYTLYSNTTGSSSLAGGYAALYSNTVGTQNVALGQSAMYENVARSHNTAIGFEAMRYADDTTTPADSNNTAVGYQALMGSTTAGNNTGTDNTAIGTSVMDAITSGSRNVGLGGDALGLVTTASDNVAIGRRALSNLSTGNGANVAVGDSALFATTGDNNTAIGYLAGDNITSGVYNIMIGSNVDAPSATGDSQLNIGNLIYGDLANNEVFLDAPAAAAPDGDLANGQLTFWVDATNDEIELKAKDSAGDVINVTVGGGGGGTPGGADTQVQYNNGGAFAGDAGFTYNAGSDTLTIGDTINVGELINIGSTTGAAAPTGAVDTSGTLALNNLTDVDTSGVSDGEVLTYNNTSGNWEAAAAGGGSGVFELNSGVVRNTGAHATEDFVFGSSALANVSGTDDNSRMFFDKSKAAFRVGEQDGLNWNDSSVGANSMAMGYNVTASGSNAVAIGTSSTASGNFTSVVIGSSSQATGNSSVAMGFQTSSSGDASLALGREVNVTGHQAVGIGVGIATGADPIVSGANSLGIFMGDQGGADLSTANTMAILGGNVGIGTVAPDSALNVVYTVPETTRGTHQQFTVAPTGAGTTIGEEIDLTSTDVNGHVLYGLHVDVTSGANTRQRIGIYGEAAGHQNDNGDADPTILSAGVKGVGSRSTPGILGYNSSNSSDGYTGTAGVYGVATSAGADGVIGKNSSGTNGSETAGVKGWATGLNSALFAKHEGNPYSEDGVIGGHADAITTGHYVSLKHDTSTFSGTGIRLDFADGASGSFTGNFLEFQNSDAVQFVVQSDGDVGIGSTSPGSQLHLYDDTATALNSITIEADETGGAGIGIVSAGNGQTGLLVDANARGWALGTYGSTYAADTTIREDLLFSYWDGTSINNHMHIEYDTGHVGIGVEPTVELDVAGDIEYTGTITDVSDVRLKDNIAPMENILDRIAQLDAYSFTMKGDENARTEFGVMAQDLEKVFPELVHTADDEIGTKSVNYVGLIGPMIEATKELAAENAALRSELAEIKTAQNATNDVLADLGEQVELLNKIASAENTSKASTQSLLMLLMGLLGGFGVAMVFVRKTSKA